MEVQQAGAVGLHWFGGAVDIRFFLRYKSSVVAGAAFAALPTRSAAGPQTDAAITAGALSVMPGRPIGQTIASMRAASTPRVAQPVLELLALGVRADQAEPARRRAAPVIASARRWSSAWLWVMTR